jgi:RNA polymerase sigma-70 factor (ECF subfamily)
VAELLDTTVASVNSALQRARATLAERDVDASESGPADASQRALLARYIDAFERYEIEALVDLLREDAVMSMHGVAQPVPGLDRNQSSSSRRCGCL